MYKKGLAAAFFLGEAALGISLARQVPQRFFRNTFRGPWLDATTYTLP